MPRRWRNGSTTRAEPIWKHWLGAMLRRGRSKQGSICAANSRRTLASKDCPPVRASLSVLTGEVCLHRHQISDALALLSHPATLGKTLGGAVDRRDPEPLGKQSQHQFPTDAVGRTGH